MEAADMYQKYVSESPENFELVFNAANTLRQIQKNEEAEKLFIKASQLKPNVSSDCLLASGHGPLKFTEHRLGSIRI